MRRGLFLRSATLQLAWTMKGASMWPGRLGRSSLREAERSPEEGTFLRKTMRPSCRPSADNCMSRPAHCSLSTRATPRSRPAYERQGIFTRKAAAARVRPMLGRRRLCSAIITEVYEKHYLRKITMADVFYAKEWTQIRPRHPGISSNMSNASSLDTSAMPISSAVTPIIRSNGSGWSHSIEPARMAIRAV